MAEDPAIAAAREGLAKWLFESPATAELVRRGVYAVDARGHFVFWALYDPLRKEKGSHRRGEAYVFASPQAATIYIGSRLRKMEEQLREAGIKDQLVCVAHASVPGEEVYYKFVRAQDVANYEAPYHRRIIVRRLTFKIGFIRPDQLPDGGLLATPVIAPTNDRVAYVSCYEDESIIKATTFNSMYNLTGSDGRLYRSTGPVPVHLTSIDPTTGELVKDERVPPFHAALPLGDSQQYGAVFEENLIELKKKEPL